MPDRAIAFVAPHLSRAAAPLTMLAAGLAGLALRVWQPSDDASSSICLFRRCTGMYCPGCGMTRAAAALMKGRWSTAWAYHPLAFLVMLQIAVGVVLWTAVGAGLIRRDLTRVLQWVLVIDLVALLTVWVLRIMTGTLPA